MKNKLEIERNRLQVIEGLIILIENSEIANEILADKETALTNLMGKLGLNKLQAQAALDLRRPPGEIQIEKIIEEKERLKRNIEQLERNISPKNNLAT